MGKNMAAWQPAQRPHPLLSSELIIAFPPRPEVKGREPTKGHFCFLNVWKPLSRLKQ